MKPQLKWTIFAGTVAFISLMNIVGSSQTRKNAELSGRMTFDQAVAMADRLCAAQLTAGTQYHVNASTGTARDRSGNAHNLWLIECISVDGRPLADITIDADRMRPCMVTFSGGYSDVRDCPVTSYTSAIWKARAHLDSLDLKLPARSLTFYAVHQTRFGAWDMEASSRKVHTFVRIDRRTGRLLVFNLSDRDAARQVGSV